MFEKRQLKIVVLSAIVTFFLIALLSYMFYINLSPKKVQNRPIDTHEKVEETMEEGQVVISQQTPLIQSSTNVVFEIVDQLGIVTQTDMYPGISWRGATELQMKKMYPDYEIKKFGEDQVILTRVVERRIGSDYIVTIQDQDIIIAIERNGHKIFYRDTGLGKSDISERLSKILDKGIPITMEQKEAILRDVDELYVILQEHDE